MVSVVFRASPLIWPTYLAQTLRPGTSASYRSTRRTPGGFHAGLLVMGAVQKMLSSRTAQPSRDLLPQSPTRSPLAAHAPAGKTRRERYFRIGLENFGSVMRAVSSKVRRKAARAALSATDRFRRWGTPLRSRRLSVAGPACTPLL